MHKVTIDRKNPNWIYGYIDSCVHWIWVKLQFHHLVPDFRRYGLFYPIAVVSLQSVAVSIKSANTVYSLKLLYWTIFVGSNGSHAHVPYVPSYHMYELQSSDKWHNSSLLWPPSYKLYRFWQQLYNVPMCHTRFILFDGGQTHIFLESYWPLIFYQAISLGWNSLPLLRKKGRILAGTQVD